MELKEFQILSVSHQSLEVEDIGQFLIPSSDANEIVSRLERIKKEFDIDEIQYLNTCNRASYIFVSKTTFDDQKKRSFFRIINNDLPASALININNYINVYTGIEAVNHIFNVSSSLDSLVVGEREIFRQFRESYAFALKFKLSGDFLRLLEKYTVQAAKYVYANTKIGEKPVSIVSLAIQKLRNSDLQLDARILLIGAGETNRLVGKFLKKYGYSKVTIFNRTLDNAKNLAESLNAQTFHLNKLDSYKQGFDGIIICTGSTQAIITKDLYHQILQKETEQKFIIDLSVPRNVDEEVVSSFDTNYIGISQLKDLADKNLSFRKTEMVGAKLLLDEKIVAFKEVFKQRELEKALRNVPNEIKSIKTRAMEQVFKDKIKQLEPSNQALIIEMMDYMEKKCIAVPMKIAKENIRQL